MIKKYGQAPGLGDIWVTVNETLLYQEVVERLVDNWGYLLDKLLESYVDRIYIYIEGILLDEKWGIQMKQKM